MRWLAAPWFAAEHFFYQQLCSGLTADPFAAAKAASLESARPIVSSPQWAAVAERAQRDRVGREQLGRERSLVRGYVTLHRQ
jgi:hypothetical protein